MEFLLLLLGLAALAVSVFDLGSDREEKLCFLAFLFAAIYFLARAIVNTSIHLMERRFLMRSRTMYLVMPLRWPITWILWSAGAIVSASLVSDYNGVLGDRVFDTLMRSLVVLGGFFGFEAATLVMTKLMASHFHKQAYFDMIQDGLTKELILHELSASKAKTAVMNLAAAGHVAQKITAAAAKSLARTASIGAGRRPPRSGPPSLREGLPAEVLDLATSHDLRSFHDRSTSDRPAGSLKETSIASMGSKPHIPGDQVPNVLELLQLKEHEAAEGRQVELLREPAPSGAPRAADGPMPPSPKAQGIAPKVPSRGDGFSEVAFAVVPEPGRRPMLLRRRRKRGRAPGGLGSTPTGGNDSNPNPTPASSISDSTEGDPRYRDVTKLMYEMEVHARKESLRFSLTSKIDGADGRLTSRRQARLLGGSIYRKLKRPAARGVEQSDLVGNLPPELVEKAWALLDTRRRGYVSLRRMRDWCEGIYNERKALAYTLSDAKTIVRKLESVIRTCVRILYILVALAIFQVDILSLWLTFSSTLLAFAFVFGNSVRTVYEATIFLFVTHPYDVNDILIIDDVIFFVERIDLLTTTCKRWDGRISYFSNAKLAQIQPLVNVTRSGDLGEVIKVVCDVSSLSQAKLNRIRKDVLGPMFTGGDPKNFNAEVGRVNVSGFKDPSKYLVSFYVQMSHSGADLDHWFYTKSKAIMLIGDILEKHGVTYTWPLSGGYPWDGPRGNPVGGQGGGDEARGADREAGGGDGDWMWMPAGLNPGWAGAAIGKEGSKMA